MTWTMIIGIVISGALSSDLRLTSVPMQNKSACLSSGNSIISYDKNSKRVVVLCINSETGETIRLTNE